MADNNLIPNPSITTKNFEYVNGDQNSAISGISGHALVGGSSEDQRVTQALATANEALSSASAASSAANEAKASIENGKFVSYATADDGIYGFDKNGNLSAVYSQGDAWNTLNSEINKLSATIQTTYVSTSEARSFSSTLYTMANSAGNDASAAKTLAETANTNASNALTAATSAGNLANDVSASVGTSAAGLSAAVKAVQDTIAEQLEITGVGSVHVTTSTDNMLIISGDEASVPENVMTSAADMTAGQWIWNDGKFIQGTSYYANYKTYTTNPNADIEVPLSGIYMTTHNNSSATNYNYIKTYAYNNSKNITTGMLYTLPKHWTYMITTAGKGLAIGFNDAKWQLSADIPDNIATSAGIDENSAYCLTNNGWSAFNYIPAKIEYDAEASGKWNNDGILHFILE